VCRWNATHRKKALEESYNFALDLIPIRGLSKKLQPRRVPGVQTGTVSGLLFGSPRTKSHSDVGASVGNILYGGRWWLPPSPGCGELSESKVARGLS